MKIALLGYGKMGKVIEQVALERGHEIVLRKSIDDSFEGIDNADISIEYGTTPGNYTNKTPFASFLAGEPAEIEIVGLTQNTKYYYRVNSRKTGILLI